MSNLNDKFPTLFSKIEEEIDELRFLIVIDENYADIDDEEADIFDPEDYNYLVYITETVSAVLGEEGLKKLYTSLDEQKLFDSFVASEEDLYGVMSELSEEEVAYKILNIIEDILKEEQA